MAEAIVEQKGIQVGARLAIDRLREAQRIDEEIGRGEGGSRLQSHLLGPVLQKLTERPDLVEGFDRVLSDVQLAAAGEGVADWLAYERVARGLRLVKG